MARVRTITQPLVCAVLLVLACSGCSRATTRVIETTAYCDCGECNGYYRGRWLYLKLNVWNRYLDYGDQKGEPYTGRTADGGKLQSWHPGLFSFDSVKRPWMIPVRIVFSPWLLLQQDGTIAADTDYYPFGTRMRVPGYGWGVVADRGGAIKGPDRIDLFFSSHRVTNRWGRQKVEVKIIRPS